MTLWEKIKGGFNNPIDIYYLIQANYRIILEKLGYLNYDLQAEIIDRKVKYAKYCMNNGECKACGCTTPALFYANKACAADFYLDEKPCYGELQNTPIKRWKRILKIGRRTGTE